MDLTFKKYNIWDHHYYFCEKWDYVVLINSESYHDPIEKYLNRRFCYYLYEKRNNREVKDYVYSYDYETYEILPTLKECKEAWKQELLYYYH